MHIFATTAPVSVVLDIPAGRVQFVATDRADTTVEVLPANAAKNRDVKAAEQTTVDYADGVLRIEGLVKNQLLGSSGFVEVTVNLPAGSQVEAKAASAELRPAGRYNTLRNTADTPDVTIHATTTQGNITAHAL